MDFDIQPSVLMKNDTRIRLPESTRQELGVIVGQFMQLRGKEELVLEIGPPLNTGDGVAYISPELFEKIKGVDIDFKILEVTLGCDPEFFVKWRGQYISAATYLPAQGEIGCDGGLGELRPMYGSHEDHVVANLQRLIPNIPAKMKRSHWAKGFPEDGREFTYEAHSYHLELAAGYHIHLGIPPEILLTRNSFNRAAMNHLVRCMDYYVSVPTIPLEINHGRRLDKGQYGEPGDYRPSNITLEYRTPGAFFLRTPKLAAGLMGLALTITEAAVSRMKAASKNFTRLHKLTDADLHEILPKPPPSEVIEMLKSVDDRLARRAIPKIRRQLEELPNYGKHKAAIEGFFSEVDEQRRPGPDLIANWKE
ncbi:MAG: hypothetical protein DRR04_12200 [Gammaproteobacteria bacterium]|nr:MAG: hypothetical protein DRR04_12200 [Gammaproteobacteria bacterium]